MPPLALIAAIGRDGLIGSSEGHLGLPWHIPEDLRRFRRVTTGHSVIMGRRTFEAIGRPLPKRQNIVLSRSGFCAEGVVVATSLDEALARAEGESPPFIIGGAAVYADALPRCTTLFLTEVDRPAEGDAFFPVFDRSEFREVKREPAKDEPDVVFVTLERILPA
ncbi:MAG: dihydrofolate reductase [Myxococcota bacterium]